MKDLVLGAIVGVVVTEAITILLESCREKICLKIGYFKKHPKLYSPIMSFLFACALLIPLLSLSKMAKNHAIESDLMMAQTYYEAGDYLSAVDLYRVHANESGIAAYNLAHMYVMGEGVKQDRDNAEQYFRAAQLQGVSEAVRDVVYLHIRYPESYSDILDAITWGYSFNEQETRMFISRIMQFKLETAGKWDSFLQSNREQSKETRTSKLCQLFFSYTEDEQLNLLVDNTYKLQTSYETFQNVLPTSTLFERYIYDSTKIVANEHGIGKDIFTTFQVERYALNAGNFFDHGNFIYLN